MTSSNYKVLTITAVIVILLSMMIVSAPSQAEIFTFNTIDETDNISDNSSWQMNPAIWGDLIVWEDYRDDPRGGWASPGNRDSNIYLYNLSSGETKRLTQDDSSQIRPDIWENYVVWEDYRNGDPDIYMLDLNDGSSEPIRITPEGAQRRPRIHGGRVVWEDYRDHSYGDIYMYDIEGDEVYLISTSEPNSLPIAKRNPDIYGDIIAWSDYRKDRFTSDIYYYDLSLVDEGGEHYFKIDHGYDSPAERAIADDDVHQHSPSVYEDTVVWTERSEGTNNVFMKTIGEEKQAVSTESSSENRPRIFGSRVVFYEMYYEDGKHTYDSIYSYDLIEEEKELVKRVELQEGDLTGVKYARNPVIHSNNIVWEERHPSDHDRLESQYDIYHTSLENEPPEIRWSKLESHTGEDGMELNVTLEEGAFVNVTAEVFDKDGDLEEVYVNSLELGITRQQMEMISKDVFNTQIPIEQKGDFTLQVHAEDLAGNQVSHNVLSLSVVSPPPEVIFIGVGTAEDDLGEHVEFLLEEGNVLYFAIELDREVESVRLVVEDYLPGGADMELSEGRYTRAMPYMEEWTSGNKTAYMEIVDEDGRSFDSQELYIEAVEPEPDDPEENGNIFYIIILIAVIIAAAVILVWKFKPELFKGEEGPRKY